MLAMAELDVERAGVSRESGGYHSFAGCPVALPAEATLFEVLVPVAGPFVAKLLAPVPLTTRSLPMAPETGFLEAKLPQADAVEDGGSPATLLWLDVLLVLVFALLAAFEAAPCSERSPMYKVGDEAALPLWVELSILPTSPNASYPSL
jgi:hypothetical protein